MHKLTLAFLTFLIACAWPSKAQDFIPLWELGKMPNSKGMPGKDSSANERVFKVGNPGMFAYFPSASENKGAAVLICPGGGYERLAYVISGTQLAKWFNTIGLTAFVLNYRLPNGTDLKQRELAPLQDAQRAMRIIRANAQRWGIDPKKIGVQGSSAGGHLAALLGTFSEDVSNVKDSLSQFSYNPAFSILVSPVIDMGDWAHTGSKRNLLGEKPSINLLKKYSPHLNVSQATPPAFIVHAFNDKSVSVRNSLLFYQALVDNNISSSLHAFPQGGHAIALRNNPGSANLWTALCESWLKETGFIAVTK
ncbi:alpha/beta hydrolase [Pedobacter sp. SYSU D00535]|uniref:alpha/beta hydrolase n=1 Tax=Pedobacter sp. SYSU D00535 TaxID=2810308 RepID=UPI001A961331|nr:alpha/beta hydrolase [Pedobacter sp. SYSU D00535]